MRQIDNNIFNVLFVVCLVFLNIQSAFNTSISNTLLTTTQAQADPQQIIGQMKVNNMLYHTICQCNPISPIKTNLLTENTAKCDPSKLKIHFDKAGKGATFDDIRHLVGTVQELDYIEVEKASFKCLDGRHSTASLGTPGGDAGEFLLALFIYEDLLGNRKLTQENVDSFLLDYLKYMKQSKFHLCTDDSAKAHLESELQLIGLNLINPKLSLVPDLIKSIISPENNGDLHFKLLLKYPEKYLVRKPLVEMFLTSFYQLLWNKDHELSQKLELDLLTGNHVESAFIEVRSEKECQTEKLAPLLHSKNMFISAFVNHLDAVTIRRKQLSKFFSEKVNHHQDAVDFNKMYDRMNHHGLISLNVTGSFSARHLPFYTIDLA